MSRIDYPLEDAPESGAVIEVADGVLWMRLPLPMALDHVNIYALDEGDHWTVIDTGIHAKPYVAIWEKLLAGPLGGKPVGRVILTHHHPDHVGNAGWLAARGADIWSTRTAWLLARMLTLDVQATPTPETLAYYRAGGMDGKLYEKRASERPFNFADGVHPIPLGFTRLSQGQTIEMGGRRWDVHIGGGHAPDHATFWSQDDNLVISGDQILPSISPNLGVYATEPEADPVSDWLQSCGRFLDLARDEHLVLCGHKRPFTGLPLRLRQLIDNHHGCLERLRAHLLEPKTPAECFLPLFKREIKGGEYGLALVEAMAHCLHLWHAGETDRQITDFGAWRFVMRDV
ncbi:MAG: MBL fold metallo-hydrolase [Marinovum sp.]|nr:MBL fold metallo-hydrolase [Marinovum sp.]